MLLGGSLDMAWVVRFVHQPHLVEEGEKTGECTTGMHSTLFVTLPWLVCEPLCLWTGSVNMAISTFETLPTSLGCGRWLPRFWSGVLLRRWRAAGVSRRHDAWPRHA